MGSINFQLLIKINAMIMRIIRLLDNTIWFAFRNSLYINIAVHINIKSTSAAAIWKIAKELRINLVINNGCSCYSMKGLKSNLYQ